jgi:catechol 2,3-dioxygenase-like lactoylglutathione lyase family enzyme
MQIDHLTVPVRDYEVGKRFYAEALEPLGYRVLLDWPDKRRVYLGVPGGPSSIWVVESTFAGSLDFSLAVEDRGEVASLHTAALAAGAQSLSEPDGPDRLVRRRGSRTSTATSIEAVHRDAALSAPAA